MACLRRAWRIVVAPTAEWHAIAVATTRPLQLLRSYVLPLALLPAAAWMLGLLYFGRDLTTWEANGVRYTTLAVIRAGIASVLGSLISVAALASVFYLVAPMYRTRRNWRRMWEVAAYGTTPMWLASLLLVKPALSPLLVIALLHCGYLYYVGLQAVAGVRQGDAAEYVAIAMVLMIAACTLLGGAIGALDLF